MIDYEACDRRFRPLLSDMAPAVLNSTRNTVYGLWPDLTLAYMNPTWFIFAYENGGEPKISEQWSTGRSVLEAVPAAVRSFYERYFRQALEEDRPWEHRYECSSDSVYRKYHLSALPLAHGQGLVIVNSLVLEAKHQDLSLPPLEGRYLAQSGFICQCCHCRRFRRVDLAHTWDWVAAWVKRPPENLSHGICETCQSFYYCDSRQDREHPKLISTLVD